MDYVNLGTSGLKVSRIALGAMGFGSPSWRSWVLDEAAARPVLERALELGINMIDTCDYYSAGESEQVLGRLLRASGARNDVVIATKVGNPMGPGPNHRGYSRKHIIEGVEASLRRLGTDRIDLYQTHIWDPKTNIEEMVEAFDFLVRQGKILYVGATDIPCWQLAKAVYHARASGLTPFATVQHHYNAVWREDERDLIPFCRAEGIGMLPYSPAARGFLAGRERRLARTTERSRVDEYTWAWYGRPEDEVVAVAVEDAAARLGVQPAQLSLNWLLKRVPEAVPVIGATRVEHVDAAVAAITFDFEAEIYRGIDQHYCARPAGGHF
jgi:aryl-alcohol dehydrogenase-like predicted oxidoreductase